MIDFYNQPENKNRKIEFKDNQMILTLDLDKTAFKNEIERRCKIEVVEEAKKEIKKAIYKPSYSYGYSSSKGNLDTWIVDFLKDLIKENKDEIIAAAARELSESMRKSKIVREKFVDILEEELQKDS